MRPVGALLVIAALTSAFVSARTFAQTQPTQPASSSHPQKPLPAAPVTPPVPDWPINDEPKPATITWSKDQLSINAANSSLQQILANVASTTGASVDGVTKDERIFGTFGPAPARDVLAQLLQGTGYNVVMVGDQGQGLPRQIVLSARNSSNTAQGVTRSTSEDSDEDYVPEVQYDPPPQPQPQQPPQQQPPMPVRPGFNPGVNAQQPPQTAQPQPQPEPAQQPANPPNQQ